MSRWPKFLKCIRSFLGCVLGASCIWPCIGTGSVARFDSRPRAVPCRAVPDRAAPNGVQRSEQPAVQAATQSERRGGGLGVARGAALREPRARLARALFPLPISFRTQQILRRPRADRVNLVAHTHAQPPSRNILRSSAPVAESSAERGCTWELSVRGFLFHQLPSVFELLRKIFGSFRRVFHDYFGVLFRNIS